MDNKGVELTVNTLIVMVLAVIVLAATLGILSGVWTPGSATLGHTRSFQSACTDYASAGCCADSPVNPQSCASIASSKLIPAAAEIDPTATTEARARQICCQER